MSWGGTYGHNQIEACYKPFVAKAGITTVSLDSDDPATRRRPPASC